MPSGSFGEFQNRSNMQIGLNKQRGKPEDRGFIQHVLWIYPIPNHYVENVT